MRGPRRFGGLPHRTSPSFRMAEMSRPRTVGGRLVALGRSGCCWWARRLAAEAQAKDDFVRALIDLSQAVGGATGREGPGAAVVARRDGQGAGASGTPPCRASRPGFAGAITSAAPAEAARMHATLGATYLERGRVADAVLHLDQAATLDPSFAPAHLLRGLAHARLNQTRGGCGGVCRGAKAGACVGPRRLSVSAAPPEAARRGGARSGTRGAA